MRMTLFQTFLAQSMKKAWSDEVAEIVEDNMDKVATTVERSVENITALNKRLSKGLNAANATNRRLLNDLEEDRAVNARALRTVLERQDKHLRLHTSMAALLSQLVLKANGSEEREDNAEVVQMAEEILEVKREVVD